jgi:hypothetical protein
MIILIDGRKELSEARPKAFGPRRFSYRFTDDATDYYWDDVERVFVKVPADLIDRSEANIRRVMAYANDDEAVYCYTGRRITNEV